MTAPNPPEKFLKNSIQMRNISPKTTGGKVKKRVRLKAAREAGTIFKENELVDSPRQIISEKTSLGTDIPSSLFKSLESFYDEVAITSVSDRATAEKTAKTLMSTLLSKCTKLGRGMGFRFTRAVYAGSTMDGTQVVDTTNVDVFLVYELPIKTVKVPTLEPGYRMISLRKFYVDDAKKYDPWQFGRSTDGLHLSPLRVNINVYDLVVRALRYNEEAYVEPYTMEEGQAPIKVKFNGHVVHITPAIFLHAEDTFLVTRPYRFDEHVNSDMMWRMSFVTRERKLLETMNKTDRGMRKKAFTALKALVSLEHTLNGLDSYQIKSVLFHCFDRDVDCLPRWQRNTIENLFLDLIGELYHFLKIKNLPHFYIKGYNLLENMDKKTVRNITQRLGFIMNNPKELIRILNKRPQQPDEEMLPFGSYSRDSTAVDLSPFDELDRLPGTEVTLLDSDTSSEISSSQRIVSSHKQRIVRFNETTIVV